MCNLYHHPFLIKPSAREWRIYSATQSWHKFKCQSLHKVHTTNLNEQYYSEVENTLKEHKEENSSNPRPLYGKWIVHKITWDGTECQTLPDGEWCFIIDMYITLNGEYYTYSLVNWGNCAQVALRFSFRTRSVKALTKLCIKRHTNNNIILQGIVSLQHCE